VSGRGLSPRLAEIEKCGFEDVSPGAHFLTTPVFDHRVQSHRYFDPLRRTLISLPFRMQPFPFFPRSKSSHWRCSGLNLTCARPAQPSKQVYQFERLHDGMPFRTLPSKAN